VPRAVGAGIALADNGMAVLEALGLASALGDVPEATAPRIVDATGATLLPPPDGITLRLMRRSTLQRVLMDALDSHPDVTVKVGTQVVRADRTGRVVTMCDGVESAHEADLIVGADGARSVTRDSGAFGARVRRGIPYFRALVDSGCETGVEAWTPAGLVGAFAVDGGTYCYGSAASHAVRQALAERSLPALVRAWDVAYPPAARVLNQVHSIDDVLVDRVTRVTCRRWFDGRVVLIGDAAHAMPPNLGQGANSALVDAAVLLDEVRRATDVPLALAAFDARRRAAVHQVARAAAVLGLLAERSSAPVRLVRDRLLMPVIRGMARRSDAARILQESADTLIAIGRA
jgi:2-polyprenyl-6-methoxyphenol hydroxylase-like FAD-dependent oxidoreductase